MVPSAVVVLEALPLTARTGRSTGLRYPGCPGLCRCCGAAGAGAQKPRPPGRGAAVRPVRRGAGAGPGGAGGQFLRPGRALAAGDAPGQPDPHGAGRRAAGDLAVGVRGADPGGGWPPGSPSSRAVPGPRWRWVRRLRARRGCRCRSRSGRLWFLAPAGRAVGDVQHPGRRCGCPVSWTPAALAAALADLAGAPRGAADGVRGGRDGGQPVPGDLVAAAFTRTAGYQLIDPAPAVSGRGTAPGTRGRQRVLDTADSGGGAGDWACWWPGGRAEPGGGGWPGVPIPVAAVAAGEVPGRVAGGLPGV